ncbi:MAG: hypothetical protein LBF97_06035 [Elusimicrobiota bacterium]|jgi:hypothetical protein|nr:hypothetical protein [Elusimicrobiota bacterium]
MIDKNKVKKLQFLLNIADVGLNINNYNLDLEPAIDESGAGGIFDLAFDIVGIINEENEHVPPSMFIYNLINEFLGK